MPSDINRHMVVCKSNLWIYSPSNIADQCRQIVAANNFSDVVEVIKGKMEDIVLPVDYVDIIISEWMV
jgi:hypothetical protein